MNTKLNFSEFTAEGSPYEIGSALGELVAQNPELQISAILPEAVETGTFRRREAMLRRYCPGVWEEASGAADRLGMSPGRLTIFGDVTIRGACSLFAALPAITRNGHLLMGRSYEWTPDDELCFMTLRQRGKPAHMGFSLFLFGRFDGMNEHGLCVGMTSCEFQQPSHGEGLWFPLILRAILDQCATVDDARQLLGELPVCTSSNLLIADRAGRALIAEIACLGEDRRISFRTDERFLAAANHYVNPDMLRYDNHHGLHSELRYSCICDRLRENQGEVDTALARDILSAKMPDGVCCPYYLDGLGTLRSMLFDVTESRLEVCFGSPGDGKPWLPRTFDAPVGSRSFSLDYRNEFAENPQSFWRFLPPGGR